MNRRTTLVTAATVGATLLAGSAAIAANIGVLSAAGADSIGNLSAEATVAAPTTITEPQVVDIYLEDPVPTPAETTESTETTVATPETTSQDFAVEGAGTITLDQDEGGLRVTDVDANDGWLWKTEQSSATELVVTFASRDTIYEFYASVDDNGVVDARVDQPIVNVVQVPGPAPAPSGGATSPAASPAPSAQPATPAQPPTTQSHDDDGHDEAYEDDDHDDEHDDVEYEEHEGGEDDD